ncbi:hypothetical protein B0H17DRAFT_1131266 [Mycena rosella]|uniref:Uncharacterized protein n=1 Tax=Mycena rosella TaxID=1033263 RepID=A0AAD7GM53_MYCRO|nr:hypothetical protein B0H17DRAFT_1131266 [Mycena rosella]
MHRNTSSLYGNLGPPRPPDQHEIPEGLPMDLRMHQQDLGLGPLPSSCGSFTRSQSFEPPGQSRHPHIQRSSSGVLPTIYDLPDPAFLNQYTDRGIQDYQHSPSQSTHNVVAPVDLAAMLSSLNLRQNQIDDQNRILRQMNSALQARVDLLEHAHILNQPTASDGAATADAAPVRGSQVAARGGAQHRGSGHPAPSIPGTVPVNNADLPSLGNVKVLSDVQKQVRLSLKRDVRATFQAVCSVGTKDDWSDPQIRRVNEITGKVYLTPNFESGVTDAVNMHIFAAVAKQVENEFKDVECQLEGLATCGASWDINVIKAMAKEAFPNYKRQWTVAHNEAANLQKAKVNQHRSVADKHAKAKNLDSAIIRDLMHEEHMSDEASGPEDESQENFSNWKWQMAAASGHAQITAATLAEMNFVKVLELDWHSSEFSVFNAEIHGTWFESLSARQKNTPKYSRMRSTGRRSSRIPTVAPFNFEISQPWLERHCFDPKYRELLSEWNSWPNPPGFGSSLDSTSSSRMTIGVSHDSPTIDPSLAL